MKITLCTLGLLLLAMAASAQSKNHPLGIVVGGGPQDYKGELGNGFTESDGIWRGAVVFNAAYYLNRSFDAGIFGSVGSLGYCQSDDVANEPIDDDDRCPGCLGRVGLGNLSSRLTSGGIMLRYKIANGYLLKETSRVRPYIYAGAAANYASDVMKMNCVKVGNYFSLNGGAGVKYYVNERINIGYNLAFGYLTQDDIDFMSHDGGSDMYMQNSLTVGIDLF